MPEYIFAVEKFHFDAAVELFNEYATWLNIDLSFQNFEKEKLVVQEMYAQPKGAVLLVKEDEIFIACVALRPLNETTAELKRMYVKPAHRNKNIAGEMLLLIEEFALAAGYRSIKLDTLSSMLPAMNFYKKNGYAETEPYYYNPNLNTVYFEKELK